MNKNEFKTFCKKEFEEQKFKKFKNNYYFIGEKNVSCKLSLQKSRFGSIYYVNYDFFLGEYTSFESIQNADFSDIDGRFTVMSKKSTIQGKNFITGEIEYEEYDEKTLKPFFDKCFNDIIFPPINHGKKYILDNLNKLYFLSLNAEKVLDKLQSDNSNAGDG